MKLPSYRTIDFAIHVWAFLVLSFLGISWTVALPAPGERDYFDPVFFPENPESAAPLWLRLVAVLAVSLVFLVPALWIITVQLATRKKGAQVLGWCVAILAVLIAWEGRAVVGNPEGEKVPAEWMFGYSAGAGLAAAVSGYLLFYARWIYALRIGPIPTEDTTVPMANSEKISLSPETKQLLVRLALFVSVVLFALIVTWVLSLLPQFGNQPHYITIGFFGVMSCGMVVTGLIREQTLSGLIPWFKSGKEE